MPYQYNLSDFSNKLLDRIGEIYYGSIGEELPANFDTIKQNFEKGNIINSYEKKLESEKGNLGYYDVSISEIVNDFLKYLGSRDHWEIIREGNSLKLKKIGRPGLYTLYSSPISFSENAVSLWSSLSIGSDSSRSTTPVSFYSPYITPSSSSRGSSSDSSQVTTPSSSSSGKEGSLDDFLKNSNNSNKGGKKRSKRRRSKRRKSRKGKSKRRK